MEIDPASGLPFYRQIVDQMGALIRSGGLPAGARLPSVRKLSGELMVSLITVRRAYQDLAAAGLIVQRQGQGSFVGEGAAASADGVRAEARALLSGAVVGAQRLGLDPDEIRKMVDGLLDGEGS